MTFSFKAALGRFSWLRHRFSVAFCLQLTACAVVAWSVFHGSLNIAAPAPAATPAPVPHNSASGAALPPAAAPVSVVAPAAPQLAAVNPLAGAQYALSTID